jgi:RHS repeat-associated protein
MRINNGVTNYYIYGKGLVYEIDETATTTNTAFYHFDSRGSTIALTDGSGNPTDVMEYSPYGTISYRRGTNSTPFLYNGCLGVLSDVNGLLYMRARYYNPYISRFINPDPSGFNGGLNFYAYVNGNPISLVDPFGLGGISAGEAEVIRGWIDNPATAPTISQLIQESTASQYVSQITPDQAQMLAVENTAVSILMVGMAGQSSINAEIDEQIIAVEAPVVQAAASPVAAEGTVANSQMTTVLGSGRDVAPYVGQPGFNTFTGAGIPAAELDTQNALWLNNAVQRGDQIWLVTDPGAHAALLQSLPGQPQSAYLNLELPMLNQYSGVNAIPKYVAGH